MLTLNLNGTLVLVSDLQTAVRLWEEERDRKGLGASDCKRGCGNIRNESGELIARVSYNGRVWSVTGEEMTLS